MREAVSQPARIERRNGHRMWLCPNCGKPIGEILGSRLVIRVNRRTLTYPLTQGIDQTCPMCGAVSQIVNVLC